MEPDKTFYREVPLTGQLNARGRNGWLKSRQAIVATGTSYDSHSEQQPICGWLSIQGKKGESNAIVEMSGAELRQVALALLDAADHIDPYGNDRILYSLSVADLAAVYEQHQKERDPEYDFSDDNVEPGDFTPRWAACPDKQAYIDRSLDAVGDALEWREVFEDAVGDITCSTCGGVNNSGEGYAGDCGNCADKAQAAEDAEAEAVVDA